MSCRKPLIEAFRQEPWVLENNQQTKIANYAKGKEVPDELLPRVLSMPMATQ